MPNPFFYGGRIENPRSFIGRKTELRVIFSALEHFKDGQAQHISIVGERRIGKSSLLYHVTNNYAHYLSQSANYRFIFIDLDNARTHSLQGLLGFILERLRVSIPSHLSLEQFNDVLENLRKKKNIYPVLCFDEFEHLASRRNEFTNSVYEGFRSLGSNNKIAFVAASKTPLYNLIAQSNMTSTFPNIFTQLSLGEFSKAEVLQMVEIGKTCDHPFNNEETRRMQLYGGRSPYNLQVAGSKIYLAKVEGDINWKQIEAQIKGQIASVRTQDTMSFPRATMGTLERFLQSLGRAIHEFRTGKIELSDSSARWVGIAAILIILFLLLIKRLPEFILQWLDK